MSTLSLENILSRARVIASQMGGDATQSPVIDNKSGLRALLNHAINEVYRRKATDNRFLRDITVRHTVSMSGGTGAVPTQIMKEFLRSADFEDDNGSLITYYDFAVDYNSAQNFTQLGYVFIQGDSFQYTEPSPGNATSYSGNLFVTGASVPVISTNVTFPSTATAEDVILMTAKGIRGEVKFELIDMAA